MSNPKRRAYWLKTLHQWHWISAALCLIAILLLSFTGITLNHAAQIQARPRTTALTAQLPETVRAQLSRHSETAGPLPQALRDWLSRTWSLHTGARTAEWSQDEIYIALPRPGGDAWVSIDRGSGDARYEDTDRGWIAYLNDLHKGRHAGPIWTIFLDVIAAASLIFSITGLLLLKMHASQRPTTWPMVGLGLTVPLVLALLFIH